MKSTQDLLFIEPDQPASLTPLIDRLTRQMAAAFRRARPSDYVDFGFHTCSCGAESSCIEYFLSNGWVTNSLCIHYLAYHRHEVPNEQLEKVATLDEGEKEPSDGELQPPRSFRASAVEQMCLEDRLGNGGLAFCSSLGLDVAALAAAMRNSSSEQGRQARVLGDLLIGIPPEARPAFAQALRDEYGEINRWASEGLRGPGWQAQAWVPPQG